MLLVVVSLICVSLPFALPKINALIYYYHPPSYSAGEIPAGLKIFAVKIQYGEKSYGLLNPESTVDVRQKRAGGKPSGILLQDIRVWTVSSSNHVMMVHLFLSEKQSQILYNVNNEAIELWVK